MMTFPSRLPRFNSSWLVGSVGRLLQSGCLFLWQILSHDLENWDSLGKKLVLSVLFIPWEVTNLPWKIQILEKFCFFRVMQHVEDKACNRLKQRYLFMACYCIGIYVRNFTVQTRIRMISAVWVGIYTRNCYLYKVPKMYHADFWESNQSTESMPSCCIGLPPGRKSSGI